MSHIIKNKIFKTIMYMYMYMYVHTHLVRMGHVDTS